MLYQDLCYRYREFIVGNRHKLILIDQWNGIVCAWSGFSRIFKIREPGFDHIFHGIYVNIANNDKRLQIRPVPVLVKLLDSGIAEVF